MVFGLTAIYLLLMLSYHTVYPSDIYFSLSNRTWSIDSVYTYRAFNEIIDTSKIDSSRNDEHVFGIGIYARNNINSALKIDSFQVMDISNKEHIRFEYYGDHSDLRLNKNIRSSIVLGRRRFHCSFIISKSDYPCMRTAFNNKTILVVIYSSRGPISLMPRPYYTSWLYKVNGENIMQFNREYKK